MKRQVNYKSLGFIEICVENRFGYVRYRSRYGLLLEYMETDPNRGRSLFTYGLDTFFKKQGAP